MFCTAIGGLNLNRSIIHVIRRHYTCDKSQIQRTNTDLGEFAQLNRRSSYKNPQLYVANNDTAVQIITSLSKYHNKNVPFVELNPGPCVLTRQLVKQLPIKRLILVEEAQKFEDFHTVSGSSFNSSPHGLRCEFETLHILSTI